MTEDYSTTDSDGGRMQGWDSGGARAQFPMTRWTRVFRAGQKDAEAERAIDELCQLYWYPLYAFVRRQGHAPSDAQDITQGFFSELLSRERLTKADPTKGRLRTYLLSGIKNYRLALWRKESAQKRGGGIAPLSIDEELAESRYQNEPADNRSPDYAYDREWALSTLQRAVDRLRNDYTKTGQTKLFDYLSPMLTGEENLTNYTEIAGELEMNEGALRVALHRMKKKYRDSLVAEISETVASPDLVEDELEQLVQALR